MLESESSPTLQKIERNTIIQYYDAEPHESSVKCPLCGLVQKLLGFFNRKGGRRKRVTTALKIDFFRDCYGNHSSTSTECPFCPLGLDCKQEVTARKEELTNEIIKNKFEEADVGADVETYSKVRGW